MIPRKDCCSHFYFFAFLHEQQFACYEKENSSDSKEMTLKFMHLNDDCLSAIFRKLSVLDKVTFGDVCGRLRSIAQREFSVTNPIVDLNKDVSYQLHTSPWTVEDETVINKASRLFRIFGPSMSGLVVHSRDSVSYDKEIVALMVEYCSGGKLTTLNLSLYRIEMIPIGLKPIFKKLRKLHLCMKEDIGATALEWLDEIQDLKVDYRSPALYDTLLQHSYRNLQRIHLGRVKVDSHVFETFLKKNITIQDIFVPTIVDATNHTFDLPTQILNLKLNVGADFDYHCINSSFGKLKNLKSLALDLHESDSSFVAAIVHEIVAAKIPLQHLILNNITLDMSSECQELCKSLSKLMDLEKFTLDNLCCEDVEVASGS